MTADLAEAIRTQEWIVVTACLVRIAEVPTGTGVGCRDKLKVTRKRVGAIHPDDPHLMLLDRLAKCLKGARLELGQLVEKEHPTMRERYLPRHHGAAPSDETAHGNGVMRCPERSSRRQQVIDRLSGDRMYEHRLRCLIVSEGWKDGRKAFCQHGLPCAWRTDHKHTMATCGCDDQCLLCELLVYDVRIVEC